MAVTGTNAGPGLTTTHAQTLLGHSSIGGRSGRDFTIELGGQPVTGGGAGAVLGGGGSVGGSAGAPTSLAAALGGATFGGTTSFDLVPGAPAAGSSLLAATASTGTPVDGGGAPDPTRALPPTGATGPIIAGASRTTADATRDRAAAARTDASRGATGGGRTPQVTAGTERSEADAPSPARATTAPATPPRPSAPAPAPTAPRAPAPAPAPAPRTETVRAPQPAQPRTKSYTIVRGDTLTSIARKFSTTVAILAKLNNIPDPNRIIAGRTIRVPA